MQWFERDALARRCAEQFADLYVCGYEHDDENGVTQSCQGALDDDDISELKKLIAATLLEVENAYAGQLAALKSEVSKQC